MRRMFHRSSEKCMIKKNEELTFDALGDFQPHISHFHTLLVIYSVQFNSFVFRT